MTKKEKITKGWREFEKLVALLESHLGPNGAIIKSPDYIPDKITGELREVDASVRYQVGSVPILITIECRDRKSIEDTRWIEQLSKKQNDIGATATIAVSSRKFSKPALKKASFYGIETRLLNEIEEDSIRDWASKLEITLFRGKLRLGALRILFKKSDENLNSELDINIKNEYEKGDVEYKFIKKIEDGTYISIGDLLRESEQGSESNIENQDDKFITVTIPAQRGVAIPLKSKFSNLFKDVPLNGDGIKKIIGWTFDPNEASVLTNQGFIEIEYLDVEILFLHKAYPANLGKLLAYKNDNTTILNVEKRKIDTEDGKTINIVISGKPE